MSQELNLTVNGYEVNSLEELQQVVPAAFSTEHHPERTERYSMLSTLDFLKAFEKLGWSPFAAKQHGANPYSRHIIRMKNNEMGFIEVGGDKIRPQIMLDNSHDGYTPGQIHMGLFRMVCSNGLVVAIPGMETTVKFRHVGVNSKELINVLEETAEQYKLVGSHISNMRDVVLNQDQKVEFAIKAVALREPTRFINSDGTINAKEITKSLNPNELFKAVRPQDEKDDLWTTFNVIQERTINGMYERRSATGRRANPKSITNSARSLEYNKKLWTLAEDFMPISSIELKNYTTAKGLTKQVEIVTDLGGGQTQVKDGNRVFAVPTERLN